MLCDRLNKIYQQALVSVKEEEEQQPNSVPIAIQLGMKKPPDIRVEEFYPTFLSMAKNFMEGTTNLGAYETFKSIHIKSTPQCSDSPRTKLNPGT